MPQVLSTDELRREKLPRELFKGLKRRPIRVILDGVNGGYNIGAIFRLCDAMLLERLTICGLDRNGQEIPTIRKHRIAQAAQGAQLWVPWNHMVSVDDAVTDARNAGYQIAVIELTSTSITPDTFVPRFPLCLVIGNERMGVSASVAQDADVAIAMPMLGMSNSLNLATAAAIVFYEVCKHA